jgi:CheY-like chemotaxis protein
VLWIEADALRLEQVLANLLDNAAKYSPPGSTIDVKLWADGRATILAVRDRGPGVPRAERSQMFERFYRGHSASHQSGMGLGLFVSKQIVELHGGVIDAEFPDDGGTQMVVRLPMASPVLAPSIRPDVAGPRAKRILVVEDDPGVRDVLTETLEEEGYEVYPATNGAEGLMKLSEHPVDLVLLDMRTPVLDGWGFARAFRAGPGPHPPVVVISAATDAAQHAKEIDAAAFLAKPFSLEEAVALVRRYVPLPAVPDRSPPGDRT